MTNPATLKAFSARDARARFGELLDAASNEPVGITQRDQLTAYLVSKSDFDAMVASIHELEDQLWLAKANQARSGGFVGSDRVKTILGSLNDTQNEEAGMENLCQ